MGEEQPKANSASDPYSLHHGTIRRLADLIMAKGFEPGSPEVVLTALAEEFQVDPELIRAHEAWDPARRRTYRQDPFVYFSDSFLRASRYARRGPELQHEGFQVVWHLRNPEQVARLSEDDARRRGEEWAKEQMSRREVPVVVEVLCPIALLPAGLLTPVDAG